MRRISLLITVCCMMLACGTASAQTPATVTAADGTNCRITFYSSDIVRVEKFIKEL